MIEIFDLFDRLVASAARHLPSDLLGLLATTARKLRHRRAYEGVLVGLAGGTGSGKSSLLNALIDEPISAPGAQRPTTAQPLVVVPPFLAPRMERMWSDLGIEDVVERDTPANFVYIDLPDIDSVEAHHRQMVEDLLAICDIVVWVTDPEKYHDRVIHHEFLRPLVAHERSYLFVINQIDRLEVDEARAILDDLEWALRRDGFVDPTVLATAADPPAGPPEGAGEVIAALVEKARSIGTGEHRMRTELRRVLEAVAPFFEPVDFNARWVTACSSAAEEWKRSPARALEILATFTDELSAVAPEVAVSIEVVGEPTSDIRSHLDTTLGRRLREALRPRAESRALATELQLLLTG
jgi:GTP-binding protein EngB required for normal cell division